MCRTAGVRQGGKKHQYRAQCQFWHGGEIGDESGIGVNCHVRGPLTIGKYVMMGPEVTIITSIHKSDNIHVPMCHQGFLSNKKITIGDDVWIGARAIILPGVTIGNGVIIGAGAIVTRNIPDFAVAAGNPAKILKYRNGK